MQTTRCLCTCVDIDRLRAPSKIPGQLCRPWRGDVLSHAERGSVILIAQKHSGVVRRVGNSQDCQLETALTPSEETPLITRYSYIRVPPE